MSILALWSHECPTETPLSQLSGKICGVISETLHKKHACLFTPVTRRPRCGRERFTSPFLKGLCPAAAVASRSPSPPSLPTDACVLPRIRLQFGAGAMGKLPTIWMKMAGKLQCLGPFWVAVCVQKLQRKHWRRPAVRNRGCCSAGGGFPAPPPRRYVFVNKCVNRGGKQEKTL